MSKEKNKIENVYSPWILEKWSIFFFEFILTFEGVITVFYWSTLYDPATYPTSYLKITNLINHALPLIVLTIDFVMNTVPFHYRHVPIMLGIMLIYALAVNLPVTLISGTPVYSVLTYKDVSTYLYILLLLVLFTLSFTTWYLLAKWKNAKYH